MPAKAIKELLRTHAVATLIEQTNTRRMAADTLVTGSALTEFRMLAPRVVLPAQQLSYRTIAPRPLGAFTPAAVRGGTLTYDSNYGPDVVLDRYDRHNNIVQQHRPGEGPTSYLWGYRGDLLLAEVKNATYAEVVAALGGQVAADRLAGATPGTDAEVRQQLQLLRERLPQARVTTYTHNPLVGMTSQTDPTGRTTTYEYDGLGRLQRVRDEQGRVLREQHYHYARP